MNDCEQLKEHYEAYALGALEGEERAALDAHLERRCPVCTAELERARWLVAQLAYLAPEAEPPAALRRKVLAGAGTTKPSEGRGWIPVWAWVGAAALVLFALIDRKSTRLNSSHGYISYAVFCLKKKKKISSHRRKW